MFKAMSLKMKIAILGVLISIALIVLGLFGLNELKRMDQEVQKSLHHLDLEVSVLMDIEQAHVNFKVQIQEWKNILIRGNNPEQFSKYLKNFKSEGEEVQSLLESAIKNIQGQNEDASELLSLRKEHQTLNESYLEALSHFVETDSLSGQKVDKLVQGMDRSTSEGMQALALKTEQGFDLLVEESKKEMSSLTSKAITKYSITVLVFVLIVVGVMLYIFYDIFRLLGAEPSYAADIVRKVAAGRLDAEIVVSSRFGQSLIADIAAMKERLVSIVGEVKSSADSLASASEEVNATAQSLAQGASTQAASVEETSAAMEEMSASISQNNENANITDGMAQQAATDASSGGEAVAKTVEAMQKIADRISVIDDIAYQTNLLALNAAIEAGRAGEHGRGFAVVASEVRKLAERSQVAAQDIGQLALASVKQAELAGSLLEQIVPSIKKTADLVQEIAAASSEQTSGVQQINAAIGQVNTTMQQNAAASEELSATSEEMSSQALSLIESIDFFVLPERISSGLSKTVRTPTQKTSSPQPVAKKKHAKKGGEDDLDQHFVGMDN